MQEILRPRHIEMEDGKSKFTRNLYFQITIRDKNRKFYRYRQFFVNISSRTLKKSRKYASGLPLDRGEDEEGAGEKWTC